MSDTFNVLYIPNGHSFQLTSRIASEKEEMFRLFLEAVNDEGGYCYTRWKLDNNLPIHTVFSKEEFEVLND